MGWNMRPTYGELHVEVALANTAANTAPSGFNATLPNLSLLQPMLVDFPMAPGSSGPGNTLGSFRLGLGTLGVNQDRRVGAFMRDAGVGAGIVGELGQRHYVPVNVPDGRAGHFVIGRSPIGRRHPIHKIIQPGVGGQNEVEQL